MNQRVEIMYLDLSNPTDKNVIRASYIDGYLGNNLYMASEYCS